MYLSTVSCKWVFCHASFCARRRKNSISGLIWDAIEDWVAQNPSCQIKRWQTNWPYAKRTIAKSPPNTSKISQYHERRTVTPNLDWFAESLFKSEFHVFLIQGLMTAFACKGSGARDSWPSKWFMDISVSSRLAKDSFVSFRKLQ